jgi:hypothetical protein
MPETPTSERLAVELVKAGAPPAMIERARAGYYDDYKSELAMPITQLVVDARAAGLPIIAERASAGEFDASQAESDAWARSPEAQALFRELTGDR